MKTTKIEWCDSSLNIQMGCHGCELWNPKIGVLDCYAGQLTRRFAGKKGWPAAFEEPAIFLERLAPALRWPDLTNTRRPDKPWLDGMPRLIFLNDMGDTFTEGLPLDWLTPALEPMAESPHQWLILTKRPKRMVRFFEQYGRIPANFWLMTSATSQATWDARVPELIKCRDINPYVTLGVSCEPLRGAIDTHAAPWGVGMVRCDECGQRSWMDVDALECPWCGMMSGTHHDHIDWIIAGGESGIDAMPSSPAWFRGLRDQTRETRTAFFFKQWGEYAPVWVGAGLTGSGHEMQRIGKEGAGRTLDGLEWTEMPVRERETAS